MSFQGLMNAFYILSRKENQSELNLRLAYSSLDRSLIAGDNLKPD